MFKVTTASTVLFLGLVACGSGQPAPSDPSAEVDTRSPEPAASEVAEPSVPEPEPAKPEAAEPEPAEPAPEAEEPKPAPPPTKPCSEHKKKLCEVTMGCVWHTQKKCIDGQPQ